MNDVMGKHIHPGCRLAYAIRSGNSSALLVGIVSEVNVKECQHSGKAWEEVKVFVTKGRWGKPGARPSLWADSTRMVIVT